MGRGSWYAYTHHVLYDYDTLVGTTEDPEDFDEDQAAEIWQGFVEDILDCFDAYEDHSPMNYRDAYCIGATTRFEIGIDNSGGYGCIFLEPRHWYRFGRNEVEYRIDRDAKRGFEKLMKLYPGVFRFATSDYTSGEYQGVYSRTT